MTYLTDIISYQVDGVTIVEGVGTNSMCVPRFFSLGKQEEAPSEHLTICAAKVDSERERDRLLYFPFILYNFTMAASAFSSKKKEKKKKRDCHVKNSKERLPS
jgi:hypothetical protein